MEPPRRSAGQLRLKVGWPTLTALAAPDTLIKSFMGRCGYITNGGGFGRPPSNANDLCGKLSLHVGVRYVGDRRQRIVADRLLPQFLICQVLPPFR